ncbi:MAG: two-component system, cell cycle response regulator [Thermoanaerobaculia bacterium]|jgi:two-component system cell cycle response regulator|nr:two-component system, cell cycle response regulator [Thermoanaerobaculia bacterium]
MCSRFLIVDDDPVDVHLLGLLLRALGHQATLALDGASALRESGAQVPDLVLCDIQMPEMDEFEVMRSMRHDERLANTPILGLTALAMVADREKILGAGFDGYMTKPITPETFVQEVEKYLTAPPKRAAITREAAVAEAVPGTSRPEVSGYVLVVDDVPENLHLIRHLCVSLGRRARTATNAHEALEIARAAKPRLIISAIHMPGGDGFALLDQVRSDPLLVNVPFVIISSSGVTPEEERRALAGNVEKILLRPLDAEELLDHLAQWIPAERER